MDRALNRRQVLAGGLIAGAAWSAPSITQMSFATAAAQTDTGTTPIPCLVGDPDPCIVSGVVPFGVMTAAEATVVGDSLLVEFQWENDVLPAVSPTVSCCGASDAHDLDPCVGDEVTTAYTGCEVSRQVIRDLCGPGASVGAVVRWYFSAAGAEATIGAAVVEAEVVATGSSVQIVSQRVRSDLDGVCVPVPVPEPEPSPSPSSTPSVGPTAVPRPKKTTPPPQKVPKFSG